jgi:hypothetical protein
MQELLECMEKVNGVASGLKVRLDNVIGRLYELLAGLEKADTTPQPTSDRTDPSLPQT